MIPVIVPTTDVNSDSGFLVAWRVESHALVAKGAALAEIETSKALIEVDAPGDGFLLQAARAGDTVSLTLPIGFLFDDIAALNRFAAEQAEKRVEEETRSLTTGGLRATQQARKRSEELGVDLGELDASRLITVQDVEAAAAARASAIDYGSMPKPLAVPSSATRILLIGGAYGAMQVLDILRGSDEQQAVAVLDDDRANWGGAVFGVPVVGGTDRLKRLFSDGAFDAAIITIGTSIPARVKFRELCARHGVPLANAIDRTARISQDVKMGAGNIICAFCHFATETVIGDNNFISAMGSFDHHNEVGSEITTGPNCVTSGIVRIGNRVKMGMGVRIEPKVEVGDDVQIASGAVILRSVPAGHSVKTKIITTAIVQNRPA